MASTIPFGLPLALLLTLVSSQPIDFVYNGFNQTTSQLQLVTDGAIIAPSGAVRLTDRSHNVIGRAFYPEPIQIFTTNSSSPSISANSSSFSTSIVFAIVPSAAGQGGHGIAFVLSPSMEFPNAEGGHYLGILGPSNDRNPSNHIFAVEFDTVNGYNNDEDTEGNHVGININSVGSVVSEPASYHFDNSVAKEDVKLESGQPIQAWIEYDGWNKRVNVTVASPLSVEKPSRPLISHEVDLHAELRGNIYVGFSAATGDRSSSHYILGWSFCVNCEARPLDASRLPLPPEERKSSSFEAWKAILVALLVLVVLLLGALIAVVRYKRKKQFEGLEDWELDCPHRFRYKDLYAATKGFKESERLGVGGFGEVYKGVLPAAGAEIAVKKISNNSIQGVREFVAEIESLGRLRHKNLVNLQGWCKRDNDLLLVYEYVPNGSLGSLLFNRMNHLVLSWEQRLNIVKGIAAGLLYLHEEWEQVVIHRDVKSSNVLIDANMNGKLGDFGLARLYDHGTYSHTTNVVGTVGYIAPELAQTGQASTSSDVYAYGVLLLEVACGRGPIFHEPHQGHVMLKLGDRMPSKRSDSRRSRSKAELHVCS